MTFSEQELRDAMFQLQLTEEEIANLLSITPRTVSRWLEDPTKIPGASEQAIRAWLKLQKYKLAWRPNDIGFGEDDQEYIKKMALQRNESINLSQSIDSVIHNGGSKLPWSVDIERGVARLETIEVSFYKLEGGGFSPASYRRKDNVEPDLMRDQPLIEEAWACISLALSKLNTVK